MALATTRGTGGIGLRYRPGDDFIYNEPEFVVESTTIGKQRSPEHEEILRRVRLRQLERALELSAERRRRWGLPELS